MSDAFIYAVCFAGGELASQFVYLSHERERGEGILKRMKEANAEKYGACELKKFAPKEAK